MKNIKILLILILLIPADILASDEGSGLPVPRFASVKSKEANVRTGPGKRYPIKWVFVRQNMPVEIVEEFELWRKIRDIQGDEGWIHKSQLSGQRTAIVKSNNIKIYSDSSIKSSVRGVVESGVVVKIKSCEEGFCKSEVSDISGYLESNNLWGVYFGEEIDD